mgnify:CR=1 FL=1
MENQPLTPYSNRGFNAQFLSIVPYSNPLLLDGVIASVDSLRIKFTYPKCYTDLAMHERHDTLVFLLDRLTDNSRWLLGQYDVKVAESRFKIGNYAYSVNFELRNDVSFTVLVGRYATPESATGYAYDKVNQLRHVRFLKDKAHTLEIMKLHASVMAPKFECVAKWLNREIKPLGIAHWNDPKGGYFVSLFAMPGTAKRVWTAPGCPNPT